MSIEKRYPGMFDNLYFDRQGQPMTLEEYGQKFQDFSYKRIAWTDVDDYAVSTVWLGMNHAFGEGPPLIFETMVFKGESRSDMYCDRYSTEEEARQGHAFVVAELEKGNFSILY